MESLLKDLNPAQQEAVSHTEGPLLILAGAGSGKTRVLTYRIAYLLAKGVPPAQILAVTFTNKAAQEMKERVVNLVGPVAERIWISTFHAACVRILRQDGTCLGLDKNFVIYDTQDQLIVVKEAMRELNLSEKNFNPRAILSSISKAKNELVGPEDYQNKAADFWTQAVAKIYPLYQKNLQKNSAVDFDDLIMYTVKLLAEFPEVLQEYQERFRYILIDEYQDTNHAQYNLVKLLAAKYRNLCVVGDDDQSIYSFRCADIRNILEFEKDYPEVMIVKLEQNYRSTQKILQAANEVIRNNSYRKAKTLWTENEPGDPATLYQAADEREEARWVTQEIEDLRKAGYSYGDIGLLYRINAQSRTFEEALIQKGIPYKVVGGLRFYDRKEIRDILAYLRLIYNLQDRVSLRRIINTPKRGIGQATVERLIGFLDDTGLPLLEGLSQIGQAGILPSRAVNLLNKFYYFLLEMVQLRETSGVSHLTKEILEKSGYLQELQAEDTVEAKSRLENLDEFLALTTEFEKESDDKSLGGFLETVALVAEADQYDQEQEGVTLMTIHSAKGLEFPVVFLVGMEEGIFPHSRSLMESAELEEERRLCYVGMTRAKKRLYLTYAAMRNLYGGTQYSIPSRFLGEISPELLDRPGARRFAAGSERKTSAQSIQPKPKERTALELQAGDKVAHEKWGIGTVISVNGQGDEAQVTVAFPGLGIKKLILSYAPLEKV
ncbi:MAG TPA: DNA helicase PcrA [Bacillota bacterium]